MSREDTYDVTVTVHEAGPGGADLVLGTFDKLSGGNVEADDTKYRPGGMQPEVSLGGLDSKENVTVSRLLDLSRDHAISKDLHARVGKATVTVSKQPLDRNGVKFGSPVVYNGTLVRVGLPDHDSESTDAGLWELEISVAEVA